MMKKTNNTNFNTSTNYVCVGVGVVVVMGVEVGVAGFDNQIKPIFIPVVNRLAHPVSVLVLNPGNVPAV